MGCIISIIGALVTLTCPSPRPTPEVAATILASAPSLSNRTNVYILTTDDKRSPVVPMAMPPAPPRTSHVERSTETGRALHMGIPGGWTPLEWAILHAGGR